MSFWGGWYRNDQVAALPAAAIPVAPDRAGSEWQPPEKEFPGRGRRGGGIACDPCQLTGSPKGGDADGPSAPGTERGRPGPLGPLS